MKYFKLIISICLVPAISFTNLPIVCAFGSYTHNYIGSLLFQNSTSGKYTIDELKAYQSGLVIADIGILNWDKKYIIESDSLEFKNRLIENATKSDSIQTKLFALGWSDHVYQDKNGSVAKMVPDIKGYREICLVLDKYILNKKNKSINIENLFIDYDLIRKTYSDLCKISPTNEEILLEIESYLEKINNVIDKMDVNPFTAAQETNIEKELQILSNNCGKNNPDYSLLFSSPDN